MNGTVSQLNGYKCTKYFNTLYKQCCFLIKKGSFVSILNQYVMLKEKTKRWLEKNACVSLKGKTAVVTGCNSGVGYKTAETMAYLGANVIFACRNMQKANLAREIIVAEYPESVITVMELDLADFSSIDAFVDKLKEQAADIDIFVNNAGVFHQPDKKTKDGFELIMGTNYLGVYYLTEKLVPYLTSLPHEVIYINTISLIHKVAKIDYKDFFGTKRYRNLAIYARSKLCLAKYTYHKAHELEESNVHMYMNHPGIALTPLGLNAVGPRVAKLQSVVRPLFNSPEKSSLSVSYILSHVIPVGSIVGPDRAFGGWGYPRINRIYKKVKTGAGQLIAFTRDITFV